MKKTSIWPGVSAPMIFALLTIISPCWGDDTVSVAVKTIQVKEKPMGETLLVYGVIDPDPDQVLGLSLPRAGVINRVWVRSGQRVQRGDRLLEVVTAPDARMQYLQAQSAVDFSKREARRMQQLLDNQLATRTQLDAAKKTLSDAKATLDALRKRGLDRTKETLRAPVDGIVTRLDVGQGQRVQSDASALLIASERHLIARLGVEPEDLPRIAPGTSVVLTSVFVPGVEIKSRIREIHAMINPNTHLVEALAPIPAKSGKQWVLGSRILGHVRLAQRPALVVPRSAVLRDARGVAYVFVVREGIAHRVDVRPDIERNDEIAVMGPLTANDIVVSLGNYELHDGMSVRVRP